MPRAIPTHRVFISYARSDGAVFAGNLRAKLDAENIPLWQDRSGMEGGRDWWLQITDAIDHVEFMVLVMTPAAMASPVVRKEWRYARQKGVCVYPVKAGPDLDFASLPRWMSSAHFYDLDHEWPKFINDLNTRCQQPRVPFMVEDLPEDFVPREQEFNALIGHLLSHNRENPVAITAALRGAGGYGKTTLAKAICHNEDIQNAFDDGILWVTLGENPGDLSGKVTDLIKTLNDEQPTFAGLEATTARFRELISERDILLVIDDVWDQEHLRPFLQGGERCARLVTTRNLDTLPNQAKKVSVAQMQRTEAMRLLQTGLPDSAQQISTFRNLAVRLGDWPLLMKLANGALQKRVCDIGQPLEEALSYVQQTLDRRGVTAFDARNPVERNHAVAKTMALSTEMLTKDEKERLSELAVFAEGISIPFTALEKFWAACGGLDKLQIEELTYRLFSLSLLANLDPLGRTIRLHGTIHHLLISELNDKLPLLHDQILAAYNSNKLAWEDVVDDGYIYSYLAFHLANAGRGRELVNTLASPTFLVSRLHKYGTWAVEEDLELALDLMPQEQDLREVLKVISQSGHLLNRAGIPSDIEATLSSRLQSTEQASILHAFRFRLKPPYIEVVRSLPDLPFPSLVRTLVGHSDSITSCRLSADEKTLVSASSDQTLKLWDFPGGREKLTLSGHTGAVLACDISFDGSTIVSASWDSTLKIWDTKSGEAKLTLSGHQKSVAGCAFSIDGNLIVSASWDRTLKVWDAKTGKEQATLVGHEGQVFGCKFINNDREIVSWSNDGTIRIWEVESSNEIAVMKGHSSAVSDCAMSSDGALLVSALWNNTLIVWDVRASKGKFVLRGHLGSVFSCSLSNDGRMIISASNDGTLKVWDAYTGVEKNTLVGHTDSVNSCTIGTKTGMTVSASDDGTLKIWNPQISDEGKFDAKASKTILACQISLDGRTILRALDDNSLVLNDFATDQEKFSFVGHSQWARRCVISLDSKVIASASDDGSIRLWNTETGQQMRKLVGHSGPVNSCVVNENGSVVVSASFDRTLKVWDGVQGLEVLTLVGHSGSVNGCALSRDGTTIVSVSDDGTVKVWDALSGNEKQSFEGSSKWLKSCQLSGDGKTIIAIASDATIRAWDSVTRHLKVILKGHRYSIADFSISHNDSKIVSVSNDGTIKVWHLESGVCLTTLYVDGPLYCCSWHPDGEQIVAGGVRGSYSLRYVEK